jgi:flavin reductase (DIM6/NTAB) family NADH-FMN oxidoreductase RutF
MARKILKPSTALYPVPVVLLTCTEAGGRPNMITLAWVGTVCSEPPMISVSIRPHRHSYPLVKKSGEFVINIPTLAILEQTDKAGIISGRDTDKFAALGLTPIKAEHVAAPLIAECPVNIECVVRHTLLLGTHEMFVGEVLAVHADEPVLDARNRVDFSKAMPFCFNLGDYWSLKQKVGSYGFSKGKR